MSSASNHDLSAKIADIIMNRDCDISAATKHILKDGTDLFQLRLGGTVTICGIEWILVHRCFCGNQFSFIANNCIGEASISNTLTVGDKSYNINMFDVMCSIIRKELLTNGVNSADNVELNVHLPKKNHLEGEWKYFADNSTREAFAATNLDGVSMSYLVTSDDLSRPIWYVDAIGDLDHRINPNNSYGFRPCLEITIK